MWGYHPAGQAGDTEIHSRTSRYALQDPGNEGSTQSQTRLIYMLTFRATDHKKHRPYGYIHPPFEEEQKDPGPQYKQRSNHNQAEGWHVLQPGLARGLRGPSRWKGAPPLPPPPGLQAVRPARRLPLSTPLCPGSPACQGHTPPSKLPRRELTPLHRKEE